jgi:magnesium-protoporphyrin O-methyltransferase
MVMTCCSDLYHTKFDSAQAAADLSDYLQNGVKRNSRPLLEILEDLDLQDVQVLDIGSGIGAMTFELLKRGAVSASLVDISSAYLDVFKQEARRRQLDHISTHAGDCVELSSKLENAELVVMDKVICCYPDWKPLIHTVADLSTRWIAFSLPRDVWWVRTGEWLDTKWRQLRGDHFPTYIHPIGEIEYLLETLGFQNREMNKWREWEYHLYQK